MTLLVGNNVNDGSNIGGNPNQQMCVKFVAVESGTATHAVISLENAQGNFRLVAWADDDPLDNRPGTFLGVTEEVLGGYATQTELSASFGSTFEVAAGTAYWIGIHRDGYHQISSNSAGAVVSRALMDDLYSDGTATTWVQKTGNTATGPHIYLAGTTAPTPTATLSGNLQPGASFTVTYSNFDAIPVSPVTITDSNNNAITVAVTISDAVADGKHSGTATGTFPALPSSGTAQGLLFGNVTVELNT